MPYFMNSVYRKCPMAQELTSGATSTKQTLFLAITA